jgi:hypothetical protein
MHAAKLTYNLSGYAASADGAEASDDEFQNTPCRAYSVHRHSHAGIAQNPASFRHKGSKIMGQRPCKRRGKVNKKLPAHSYGRGATCRNEEKTLSWCAWYS